MKNPKRAYFDKRGQILVKNLRSRHFEAYYCPDAASALEKALELIPKGASIGWGGAMSAQQIGLLDATGKLRSRLRNGNGLCGNACRPRFFFREPML